MNHEIIASHNLRATHDILAAMSGSKRALELILEKQNDIFALFTDGGQIIKGNAALSVFVKKPADVLFRHNLKSIFKPETWTIFANKVEILNKHKDRKNVSFELPIDEMNPHEAPDFLWTITRFDSISSRRGQLYSVIGRDMTEIKRFQKRLGMIFSSVPLAILQINRDKVVSGPHSAYTEILFGHADASGLPFKTLIERAIPNMNSVQEFGVEQFLETFGEEEFWYDIYKAHFPKELNFGTEGRELWVGFSYSPIIRDARVEDILIVAEDITERVLMRRSKANADVNESQCASIFLDAQEIHPKTIDLTISDIDFQLRALEKITQENLQAHSQFLNPLHTIKGTARSAGLRQLTSVVHQIEDEMLNVIKTEAELIEVAQKFEKYRQEINELWKRNKTIIYAVHPSVDNSKIDPTQLLEKLKAMRSQFISKTESSALHVIDEILQNLTTSQTIRSTREIEYQVLTNFNRTISKVGKDVSLKLHIDEAKLNFEVLSKINAILTHVISNALDHGIESREERLHTNKPARAILKVDVLNTNDYLTIRVEDDGRGIDTDKLTASAIRQGSITEAEAKAMNQEQKLNLLFRSGVSTKEAVSEISGRGVGMDAADKTAREISANGKGLHVNSILSRGTLFEFTVKKS